MNAGIKNKGFTQLVKEIKQLGHDFGFADVKICSPDLAANAADFSNWLKNNFCGEMHYLERYYQERLHPALLVPGTKSIICCRLNYYPLNNGEQTIAAFAYSQDYTKFIRKQLQNYAKKISLKINDLKILRVFSGSAPLLEKALAVKAGLGWQGKNTLLLHPEDGSYCFLGEIFIDTELPVDVTLPSRCGDCDRCMTRCPTKAIIAPYKLDARKCISYLTIEHPGTIPLELRPLIGTRIFGCDVCQHVCPWNKKANTSILPLPLPFARLATTKLSTMFLWDELMFSQYTQGSAIYRLGYTRWLRNLAVALGNAPYSKENFMALQTRINYPEELVREHVTWALMQLSNLRK